jgi:hypothetical protein
MIRACMLAAVLTFAGCVSPDNDRITIGHELRTGSFQTAALPEPVAQVQTPSVTGIDRSNWARTDFSIPVDGTVHHPTYAKRVIVADRTARQRGQYPTASTALELWGGSADEQEWEALLNQLRSLGDLVLLPLNVILQRPWVRRMSPDIAYERYSHPERPQPEPVGLPNEPFAVPPAQRVTP